MNPIAQTLMTHSGLAALLLLGLFLPLFVFFTWHARRSRSFPLRPIPAYSRIRQFGIESTEAAAHVQMALGSGTSGQSMPQIVAGLTVLDFLSRQASRTDRSIAATSGSPVGLLAAMNVIHKQRSRWGFAGSYRGTDVQFYGPDPLAYAAGTAAEVYQVSPLANVLVGHYEDEGLWLAEALDRGGTPAVGGTDGPGAAALMYVSLDDAVIGEDLFAAGAYLHRVKHLGSLASQDWLRFVLAVAAVGGAVLVSILGLG